MKSKKTSTGYEVKAHGKTFTVKRDGTVWYVRQVVADECELVVSCEASKANALRLISDNAYETV